MSAHVEVTATVTRPDGHATAVYVGSHPVDMLPLSAEWRKSRKSLALDEVGHYSTRGDGWRVSFSFDLTEAF